MATLSKRRAARVKVVQMLYAYEMTKDPISKIKIDLMVDMEEPENIKFASDLFESVIDNQAKIDELIDSNIQNWELERIALLDKIVLRVGVAELMFFRDIPPKVSINEAIDIAKMFGLRNSGKFVNGVLDGIHNKLKKDGQINKSGRGLVDFKNNPDEK
jgi:transcription antitermination protein NusB